MGLGDGLAPAQAPRTHVVRAGETLWSIATDYDPTRDPREVVQAIETANALDPAGLVPGQQVVLPQLG